MRSVICLLGSTILFASCQQTASAIPQFQAEFLKLYINDHPDAEFTEFVKSDVKCWICHQGKKRKKNHNAYGQHLAELLDKTKDRKDTAKIVAALKKVADMRFDPDDENSATYGERIANSKLPGADCLSDLKTEPSESE